MKGGLGFCCVLFVFFKTFTRGEFSDFITKNELLKVLTPLLATYPSRLM